MLQIECPGCSSVFRVPEQHAGKRAHCPKCRTELIVPSLEEELEEAEEPAEDVGDTAPVRTAVEGNALVAIGAAAGLAVLGALVWAGLSRFTGYEVGFVAWGIGVMVGLAAWKGGGRGGGVAVACAVLALASIAAGKLGGAWLVRGAAMDEVGGYFTRELYEEYLRDTRDWSELPSDPDRTLVTTFMVEHGYTEASAPSEIEDDEFLDFLEQIAPMLEALHDEPPTYETWAEGQAEASRREIAQAYPLLVLVREGLNGFDLLWVFLGVSSAFGLVVRNTRAEAEALRQAARARRRSN